MQAVINASGESTRLRPLSCEKCAPMLKMTTCSIIEENIKHLKKHNIENILIIVGYMGEVLKKALGKGEKWGISIKYVAGELEDGALKECYDLLEDEFIYFSKALYTKADLQEFIKYHKEKNSFATVLLRRGGSGNWNSTSDGRITKVPEKRLWNSFSEDKEGYGIYLLKKSIVKYMPENTALDIKEGVLPSLIRAGKSIYVSFAKEAGECISDFASYMRANFLLLDNYREHFDKGIFVEEGAVVDKGALLEGPCYVGKGVHIKKGATVGAYSIIRKKCIISEGVNIKRSIIGEGCKIGKNSALRGCILDEKVTLGQNCSVYEQAVIGKGCTLAEGCIVRSFVRIWPEKALEQGAVVSENIMWGQKKRARLFEEGEISGVVNSAITTSFCLKLGECIGAVTDMGEVGVSTDGSHCAIMLRDSLISGLLATGCAVKDFGEQPLAITRRGVAFYMLSCGVVINVNDKDGEDYAEISLVWKDGVDIDDITRDRLEEMFLTGDVVYPESKSIKECEYIFEYKLYYLKNILNKIKPKNIGSKVLLSCPAIWGRRLIASALADLGCSVSMYAPYVKDKGVETARFEKAVRDEHFDIGFITDSKCEKLVIVTADYGAIEDEVYEVLSAFIIMKTYPNATLYVPAAASHIIEEKAKETKCNVVRIVNDTTSLMEKVNEGSREFEDQYVLRFDAVGAIVKILDFLYTQKENIDSIISSFPKINMAKAYVEMPKRELNDALERIKDIDGFDKNNPEGVKITFDKGWVLVIPDKYKDLCSVISEGMSAEIARELCDFCVEKILK